MSIADYAIWLFVILFVVVDLAAIIFLLGAVAFSKRAGTVRLLMVFGLAIAFIGYCALLPLRVGGAPRLPGPGPGERVARFDVAMHVRADGIVNVRETIDYDFGTRPRAVFHRLLATNGSLMGKGNGLHSVRARSVPPAPVTVRTYRPNPTHGRQTLIAIRPPAGWAAWRGAGHRFVIEYELRHATGDRDEVQIAPVAGSWRVPITRFHASLTGDTHPTGASCVTGDADLGPPCQMERRSAATAEWTQQAVPAGTGIVVRARFPGVRHTISTIDGLAPVAYVGLLPVPIVAAALCWMGPSGSRPRRADPRRHTPRNGLARRATAGSPGRDEQPDPPDPPDLPELPDLWQEPGGGDIGSGG